MSLIEKIDNKIDNGDVVTIVTKDYYLITKEELEEIKQELLEHQFLKKLHNQMREEMEREYCACEKMAYDNLIADIKDNYWHWTGRASCYRDLLDYYDEDWVKENVR